RENPPAVPSSAERAIDVDAVRLYRQRIHRLFEQDRNVATFYAAHSARLSKPGGKASPSSACMASCCASQPASDHSSKCEPCPTSQICFSSPAHCRKDGAISTRPAPSSVSD